LLPIQREKLRSLRDRIDVIRERERNHIGLEAIDHGTGLFSGSAVRPSDRRRFTILLLPLFGECLVDGIVELSRRVIRDVEELCFGLCERLCGSRKRDQGSGNSEKRDTYRVRANVLRHFEHLDLERELKLEEKNVLSIQELRTAVAEVRVDEV